MPNFKLKFEHSENKKVNHVNTVVFNSHRIKRLVFFGKPGIFLIKVSTGCKGEIENGEKA